MRKALFLLLILAITGGLLAGCGAATSTIEGDVWEITDEGFIINCSDEVNKGRQNVNSIGYGCLVNYSSETVFQNANGEALPLKELPSGTEVLVTLTKSVNIKRAFEREQQLELVAKEIALIKAMD